MNYFIILMFIIGARRASPDENRVRLTAVNNSCHAKQLYQQLQNDGKNFSSVLAIFLRLFSYNYFWLSGAPLRTDLAEGNAGIRRRICDDIICNKYFYRTSFELLQAGVIYRDLKHPRFMDVFQLVHNSANVYANSYRPLGFIMDDINFQEYVFYCPFRDLDDEESTYHFHISKEYNVGPFSEPYMPGRFLIGHSEAEKLDEIDLLLAEEPAKAYTKQGFDIELFYLQLRKYIGPGK